MKVVQLNAVCGVGSTGGVTVGISKMLTEHNIENYILYTNDSNDYNLGIRYSPMHYVKANAAMAKILGNYGFNSRIATYRLISVLNKLKPDIVHLHNIHGHDLNLEIFFKYLKKTNVKVVWTLHDCWNFTGYCMHFDNIGCDKWKTHCFDCPKAKQYSLFFDKSKLLFEKKKQLFCNIDNMTIVSPSRWLANLAKESFLGKFPIEVIYNGIDLDVFKPTESNFGKKHGLEHKKIVFGVPKGKYEYFQKLAELLEEPYRLVLAGVDEKAFDKFPKNVTLLTKQTRKQMAELFTAADVYVNTTLEDTFPTVNLESLSCGTPVITFDTGGSPEAIDTKTGIAVPKRDVGAIYEAVKMICNGSDRSEDCIARARGYYDSKERFRDYLKIYLENRTE